MGCELTLSTRREITKKGAGAHATASKQAKGEILDRLVAEVGWSGRMPAASSAGIHAAETGDAWL